MRIQHNIMAMSAYRNYTNNVSAMKKNLEKLSSGYKINRAGDDAAGLAISEKMRAQITGLETAQKNAKDGISLVQTAEGALTEVHDMLNRMVELATQSANGTYDNTTDRAQMQKEVDQLLEEIDRIADSSNFNGINLLDGTLGMNTDVFSVGESTGYVAAVNPEEIDLTDAVSSYHGGESVTGQEPKFTIDLNDLEIKNTGTATGTVAFAVEGPGGFSLDVEVSGVAAGANATIGQITNAITTALGSQGTAAGTTSTFEIGGLVMKASCTSGKINFTYHAASASATSAGSWSTDAVGTAGKALADAFNTAVFGSGAGKVTVEAGTGAAIAGGTKYICDITSTANAVADQPADRPGIDIDIKDLVQDGYSLTIDGKTYTFKTDKDSNVTAANGGTLIDVSMVAASKQAEQAALIMAGGSAGNGNAAGSGQTAGIFTVGLKGGTTIHIDVTNASQASKADSIDKMMSLISAKDAGEGEKVASTKLTVTGTAAKGNVLNIGGDKIEFKGGEDIDAVKTAIEDAGYTVTKDGNVLTIEGKAKDADGNDIAAADRTAPTILGKGLTLQIGDTSDPWNQLNVAVQDMHSANLGIGNLDISTEEAAQAAIKNIKDAINKVSDVRGTLGATQNRLDHTINNLSVMTENIQDAESTIRDVDVAEEMMAYTKNNILIQSAQAMLAQANQVPQGVLQLLQ